MAPRALGALLALAAAIAFVVSVASSSWWSGHPEVDGHTISAKRVRVGMLGATGCNTGGDGSCEHIGVARGARGIGLVHLGATGLATVLAFMLAVSAYTIGDRRRIVARLMMLSAALAAVTAILFLGVGPAIEASQPVDVPVGWGTFVFAGAIAAAFASSAITRKLEPEPLRLRQTPSQHMPQGDLRPLYDPGNDGLGPALGAPPLPTAAAPPPGLGTLRSGPPPTSSPGRPRTPSTPPTRPPPPAPSTPPSRVTPPALSPPGATPSKPPPPSLESTWRASGAPPASRPPMGLPPGVPQPSMSARPRSQARITSASVPPINVPRAPRLSRPSAAPLTTTQSEPAARPDTVSHTVPPMPDGRDVPRSRGTTDPDNRLERAMRQTEDQTAAADVGDATETNHEPAHDPGGSEVADEGSVSAELAAQTDLSSGRTSDTVTAHPAIATEQMNAIGAISAQFAVLAPPPESDDTGAARSPRPSQPSLSTASPSLPPPKPTQVATIGPSPACPQCESPMAWVDEHLRFYCRQCRMYF